MAYVLSQRARPGQVYGHYQIIPARIWGFRGRGAAPVVSLAAILLALADIQGRLPTSLTAAGLMKADMLAIDGNLTSASRLRRSTSLIYDGSVTGAGSPTTLFDAGLTHPDANQLKGRIVIFDGNVTAGLRDQATDIVASVTGQLTLTALTQAPAVGDFYIIV